MPECGAVGEISNESYRVNALTERAEYRTKLDEIEGLIREGKSEDALLMLDAMNFRKLHNVNALMKAADIYESVGRSEDARELLEIAHERSPIGRMIIYRLALISIELGEFDEAKEYYDEFVEIAPHDNLKYIIRYKLNKAKGANDSTLIGILEELNARDFTEEWAYELASLYHKTGQAEKCIDTCDQIILWFGEGPYVERAMEMKMLYSPLDKNQAEKYRRLRQKNDGLTEIRPDEVSADGGQFLSHTIRIPEVEVPQGKYDTINLQAEIKRNIEEIMQATEAGEVRENMAEIRSLASDIPFLQQNRNEGRRARTEADEKIGDTLMSNFQNYLIEENDGQMSLALPESSEEDPPIEGQLTISDIMSEWEKTRRAADKALKVADRQKLENEKTAAIEEANAIMGKLSDAAPRLENGESPQDIMRDEIMKQAPEETAPEDEAVLSDQPSPAEGEVPAEETSPAEDAAAAETEAAEEPAGDKVRRVSGGYVMPKLAADGTDVSIPLVAADAGHVIGEVAESALAHPASDADLKDWEPPVISRSEAEEESARASEKKVNRAEAAKIFAGMNDLLQKQIDELNQEDALEAKTPEEESPAEAPEAAETEAEPAEDTVPAETEAEPAEDTAPADVEAEPAEDIAPEETEAEPDADEAIEETAEEETALTEETDSMAVEEEVETGAAGEVSPAVPASDETETAADAGTEMVSGPDAGTGPAFETEIEAVTAAEEAAAEEELPPVAAGETSVLADTVAAIMAEDRAEKEAKKAAEEEAAEEAPAPAPVEDGADVPDLGAEEPAPESDLLPHDFDNTIDLSQVDLSKVIENQAARAIAEDDAKEREEKADTYVTEEALQQAIASEYSDTTLTDEEREAFTYFTPISGMEKSLAGLLVGARARYRESSNAASGNIIIMGGRGSGKTTLATSIIKVLQKEIGRPNDKVGKIDGDKLNSKDIAKLFAMVAGGCLIIENAGDMVRQTAVTLSLLMSNDKSGILLILEDSHEGIKKALDLDIHFAQKFTEKISIPVLTIDELVNFGEAYAKDLGYNIDEMGVLALYDRINRILRLDHPTYLTEVKEIVDEAIDKAEHGGFFARVAGRKYDEDGRRYLQEKHFV